MTRKLAGWHSENIKAELRKRFGSLKLFARAMGVTPQAVSDVFVVARSTSRVELLVAHALGETPHTLWPDRWSIEGQKLDRTALRKSHYVVGEVA